MRLDGDEMAADADDGDAGHATGTYISSVVVGSGFQGNDLVRLDEEARRSLGGLDPIMESYLDDLNASVALIGRDDFTSNHAGRGDSEDGPIPSSEKDRWLVKEGPASPLGMDDGCLDPTRWGSSESHLTTSHQTPFMCSIQASLAVGWRGALAVLRRESDG
jgi:hypothetical protein